MAKRGRAKAAGSREETALAVREIDDERVDEALVDETVVWIRDKLAGTLFKGMSEIGEYIFDHFFGGDIARLSSKNPTKNASFRSLVERCESAELPIGKSALHRAVGIAVMLRLLPNGGAAFKALPPTHQGALLPLRDPDKVERVAERAVSKRLGVRDLRQLVAEEILADDGRRTRRHKPLILKTLDRSLKLFTLESGRRSFTKAHIEELDEGEMTEALRAAENLIGSLEKLVEKLKAGA